MLFFFVVVIFEDTLYNVILGGGSTYFLCSPLFGEDSHFDSYFSKGLKPPTSVYMIYFYRVLM